MDNTKDRSYNVTRFIVRQSVVDLFESLVDCLTGKGSETKPKDNDDDHVVKKDWK